MFLLVCRRIAHRRGRGARPDRPVQRQARSQGLASLRFKFIPDSCGSLGSLPSTSRAYKKPSSTYGCGRGPTGQLVGPPRFISDLHQRPWSVPPAKVKPSRATGRIPWPTTAPIRRLVGQAERCYRMAMGGDARSLRVALCTLNVPSTCPLSSLAYSCDAGCASLCLQRSPAMPYQKLAIVRSA